MTRLADWADEVVGYRVAVGVLAVMALIAYRLLRGRLSLVDGPPRAVSDTVVVTGFAVGALLTLVLGWSAVVTAGGHGSGQWFSASIVALIAVVIFMLRLVSDPRQARATDEKAEADQCEQVRPSHPAAQRADPRSADLAIFPRRAPSVHFRSPVNCRA